jgi:subtilisin
MVRWSSLSLAALVLVAAAVIMIVGCGGSTTQMQQLSTPNPGAIAAIPTDSTGTSAVIVTFRSRPGTGGRGLVERHRGHVRHQFDLIPSIAADLPAAEITALQNDPSVACVEADAECHALDDALPWGVDKVDADGVWGGAQGAVNVVAGRASGTGIGVAIIDTGINYNHPDLAPNYGGGQSWIAGKGPLDDNGHGSHVSGIVAAADNGSGVIGVAPSVKLFALKVLNSSGSGTYSSVIAALQWCVANKTGFNIRVANMSLGGPDSFALRQACDNAYAAGIVLVAAAGNNGSGGKRSTVSAPATYTEAVIAVAGTDQNNNRASWSSTGSEVELSAPGVSIQSDYLGTGLYTMSGTSMACPHVAGAAALVISSGILGLSPTPAQIRSRLDSTATDLGAKGRDTSYGYGLVNALKATGLTIAKK